MLGVGCWLCSTWCWVLLCFALPSDVYVAYAMCTVSQLSNPSRQPRRPPLAPSAPLPATSWPLPAYSATPTKTALHTQKGSPCVASPQTGMLGNAVRAVSHLQHTTSLPPCPPQTPRWHTKIHTHIHTSPAPHRGILPRGSLRGGPRAPPRAPRLTCHPWTTHRGSSAAPLLASSPTSRPPPRKRVLTKQQEVLLLQQPTPAWQLLRRIFNKRVGTFQATAPMERSMRRRRRPPPLPPPPRRLKPPNPTPRAPPYAASR